MLRWYNTNGFLFFVLLIISITKDKNINSEEIVKCYLLLLIVKKSRNVAVAFLSLDYSSQQYNHVCSFVLPFSPHEQYRSYKVCSFLNRPNFDMNNLWIVLIENQMRRIQCCAEFYADYRLYFFDSIEFIGHLPSIHRCLDKFTNSKKQLRTFEIYKFADIWDISLMIVGSLAGMFSVWIHFHLLTENFSCSSDGNGW